MMSYLGLKEMPLPPKNKSGWPWTEECPPLPGLMPGGRPWPRITIVTPNYNFGQYIEETIRSVLLQGYPNLEYIVIDDGSTDNSIEIIRKYEKWLSFWETGANHGQTKAINRGFKKSGGEILGYLNSDDLLEKNALSLVAEKMEKGKVDWLAGRGVYIDEQGRVINRDTPLLQKGILGWLSFTNHLCQPATFWSAQLARDVGIFDETLDYSMDYDFFLRSAFSGYRPHVTNLQLAREYWHKECKSYHRDDYSHEREKILGKFMPNLSKQRKRELAKYNAFLDEYRLRREAILRGGIGFRTLVSLLRTPLEYPYALFDRHWLSNLKQYLLRLFFGKKR